MLRTLVSVALLSVAAGYSPSAAFRMPVHARAARASAPVVMVDEPSDKAKTIGAAAVGGLLGIQLTGELSTGVVFAIALAYGSTLTNKFGEVSNTLGGAGAKVYGKTLELNEQYDLVPKAKSAIDTTVTVAANLDANYQITAKIDEQLKLSQAVEKANDKLEEVKASVSGKVTELKSKASA